MAKTAKARELATAPVAYNPYSDEPPKCYKNWQNGNAFCRTCRYHKECKK